MVVLIEYYKDIIENGDVVLTEDLAESTMFEDGKMWYHRPLCILLDYVPRTIKGKVISSERRNINMKVKDMINKDVPEIKKLLYGLDYELLML